MLAYKESKASAQARSDVNPEDDRLTVASQAKLLFLCGKMAAGKSTLSLKLAQQENAVLLVQDDLLGSLYPGEIVDILGFVKYSARLRTALTPQIHALLLRGTSVVLDFPGNTKTQREWFRGVFERAKVDHELHFVDVPNELCKVQLKERSKALPAGSAWTTDAEFDAITAYFQMPTAAEGFNVIRHGRTEQSVPGEVPASRGLP